MSPAQRAAYARGYLAYPRGPEPGPSDDDRPNVAIDGWIHSLIGFPPVEECMETVNRIEEQRGTAKQRTAAAACTCRACTFAATGEEP